MQEEEKVADFIEAYNGVMTDLELKMLVEVYWDEDDPRELAFRSVFNLIFVICWFIVLVLF